VSELGFHWSKPSSPQQDDSDSGGEGEGEGAGVRKESCCVFLTKD
jgi:hypothetical protein